MSSEQEPFFAAEPGNLKKVRGRDFAVRFAFGAAVSIVAGMVSLTFNPVLGGLFLAFPAILPASVTLIEQKESTDDAVHDVEGATIGALGLAVFAVVARAGLRHTTALLALGAATAAWLASSCTIYVVVEMVVRQRRQVEPKAGATWPSAGAAGRWAGASAPPIRPRPPSGPPCGPSGEWRPSRHGRDGADGPWASEASAPSSGGFPGGPASRSR
jgi:hypothetical protein